MPVIKWDLPGQRRFTLGVSKGVLYPLENGEYQNGVNWNGLTTINETPDGGETTSIYADNIKYASILSAEQYKATINCYTFPDELYIVDGQATLRYGTHIGQQQRKGFGLCFRNEIGNDLDGNSASYQLHIIYGATCSPSEKNRKSINKDPDAAEMSFELSANPVPVDGFKPTASLIINSSIIAENALATIEAILFGTDLFSNSKRYKVNDVIEHDNELYQCVEAVITPNIWENVKDKFILVSAEPGPRILLPDDVKAILEGSVEDITYYETTDGDIYCTSDGEIYTWEE